MSDYGAKGSELSGAYLAIDPVFKDNDKQLSAIVHYTSTKVFNSLLENATFWATNILFLNDKNEYKTGVYAIKDMFHKAGIEFDENGLMLSSADAGIYTISFSNGDDLLQQWVTYAKESGVSLQLDKDLLTNDDPPKLTFYIGCYPPGFNASSVVHLMLYESKTGYLEYGNIKTAFDEAMNVSLDNPDRSFSPWADSKFEHFKKLFLSMIASYIKDDGFKIEKEVRASFAPINDINTHTDIKYTRKPDGIIRPHIEVEFKSDFVNGEGTGEFYPCLPVKVITVGPSGNQQAVFDSIVHRMKYGKICVWDYYDNENKVPIQDDLTKFELNFCEYSYGAMKRYTEDTSKLITEKDAKDISQKLLKAVYSNYLSKDKVDIIVNDTFDKIYRKIKSDMDNSSSSIIIANTKGAEMSSQVGNFDDIWHYVNKNNYFTKEGIWIKKSKIPYIF